MKITDIRIRQVKSPAYKPFTNALRRQLNVQDGWTVGILEVFTDEGITGVFASHSLTGMTADTIQKYLKPVVIGEDPSNYERVWRKMFGDGGGWRLPVAKGEIVRAISSLDTALWDVIGKKLDTPVYKLLGGFRDEVPGYASGGHYISLDDHSAEMDYIGPEMQRYMDMGFRAVKMRVGRKLSDDLERARLVREIIGPDAKLLMDFNMSGTYYGGVSETIKFMRALEEVNPFWFEDPLVMDDVTGMKQISDVIDTAIATGESDQTTWGFRDLIVNRAVDILIPDATDMSGGITEWKKIAAMADAYRMPVAAHIGDTASIHCVAGVPNGLIVEVFIPHDEGYAAHERDPIRRPNADGNMVVPQKPGLGVEIDEDYVAKHLVTEVA